MPSPCERGRHGDEAYDISVVVSTYNRASSLQRALESLLCQDARTLRYEIVVVDNNSTDSTREVVETLVKRGCRNVRYLFEPRQGVSYGRNTGILASKAPIIAFTDDDLRVSADWLGILHAALNEHLEVEYVGGKALPSSRVAWPSWVTREHWAPLALFDYGDTPFYVNPARSVCLGTGNSAYRRTVFDRVGLFASHVQAVKRQPATEDHELQLRIWRTGGQGLYLPAAVVTADIATERLTKGYHRRWHQRHGHFMAVMKDDATEQTRIGRLFGVPAHVYRRMILALALGLGSVLRGDTNRLFLHEISLRFGLGFIGTRWREYFFHRINAGRRRLDLP